LSSADGADNGNNSTSTSTSTSTSNSNSTSTNGGSGNDESPSSVEDETVVPYDSILPTRRCAVDDPYCLAECQCDQGWGGVACGKDTVELEEARALRTQVLASMQQTRTYDDVTASAITSAFRTLETVATSQPDEMQGASRALVLAMALEALSPAGTTDLQLSDDVARTALRTLNSVVAPISSDGSANAEAAAAIDTLKKSVDVVAATLLAGSVRSYFTALLSYHRATFHFLYYTCDLMSHYLTLLSTPLHSTPLHSTPLHSTQLNSTPLNSTPLHSTPLHSTPLH
jgi:hypothetical protein